MYSIVTGWSYWVGSNGVPASWNSCTRTFSSRGDAHREVEWLDVAVAAAGRSVFTGPSQSPAMLFIVSKDVCASDFDASVSLRSICGSGLGKCGSGEQQQNN